MSENYVSCPNCGTMVKTREESNSISEDRIRARYESEMEEKEKEFKKSLMMKERELEERLDEERTRVEKEKDEHSMKSLMAMTAKAKELEKKLAEQSKLLEEARKEAANYKKKHADRTVETPKAKVPEPVQANPDAGRDQETVKYLTGPDFAQRLSAIVEAVVSLKEDLETERRGRETIWAKQGKQIDRAIQSAAGLYGELHGILGADLPRVKNLGLST
jgi:hypothetical protein